MAYNNYHQLVEMIEINKLFGADHFVFYNYSTGPDVDAYLQDYQRDGLVEVIQWQLPTMFDPHSPKDKVAGIHYFGQLASLNDCLYRTISRARYIAFLDLDEILVPKSFSNWTTLMLSLPSRPMLQICSAVFRNVFFRPDWEQPSVFNDKLEREVQDLGVTSLHTVLRERQVWEHGLRSKYIADTHRLEMAGIHVPWKCLKERYNYDVPDDIALLHHYRSWLNPTISNAVQDNSLLRYTDDILQRISYRHQRLRRR